MTQLPKARPWAVPTVRQGVTELTVMTPIRRGFIPGELRTYEERLRTVLASLQERAEAGIPTPISAISTIHFARWFIVRPEQYLQYSDLGSLIEYDQEPGEPLDTLPNQTPKAISGDYVSAAALPPDLPDVATLCRSDVDPDGDVPAPTCDGTPAEPEPPILPSWLMFTSNYDGDLKAYIRAFSERIASDLDKIWGNCDGYPGAGARAFDEFWMYIRRHQLKTDAFFAAYPGLSVARIQQLRVFRNAFDAFVARTRQQDGSSVKEIAALFDEFVRENQAYSLGFPGPGGLFDEVQAERNVEIRTWRRRRY